MLKPRLQEQYKKETQAKLKNDLNIKNINDVPKIEKIIVSMGVGEAARDSKVIKNAIADLRQITGQQPKVDKSKVAIANFKLREGVNIGAHVTIRGTRAWEFFDRIISLALPRIRDFRGLSLMQFDGNGNYTFGLIEQSVFHEIDPNSIDKSRGMNITIVTTAKSDEHGKALLSAFGFPFKKEKFPDKKEKLSGKK
jgi:large subunit ribosomal protein L5